MRPWEVGRLSEAGTTFCPSSLHGKAALNIIYVLYIRTTSYAEDLVHSQADDPGRRLGASSEMALISTRKEQCGAFAARGVLGSPWQWILRGGEKIQP